MLKVTNLVKKYGDKVALDDISFSVKKGQIVGLIGPNGAGKSSTMNIITGYIPATSGTVLIDDIDISKKPIDAKKKIGYLPEIPPLYKDMTVDEYLKFVAELKYKKLDRTELVNEAIDKTNISEVRHLIIKTLSKGYQQRVGLASALVGKPELLILDEPMVGLDPVQTREMRTLIKSLADEQTVILSSHILSEVSEICDHVIILGKGKISAIDSTKALTNNSKDKVIRMSIKGGKSNIEKVLKNCKLLKDVQVSVGDEKGVFTAVAKPKNRKDIRDELFTYLADNKLLVYNISYEKMTLEEVFIQYTDAGVTKEVVHDEANVEDSNVEEITEENSTEDNVVEEIIEEIEEDK